LLAGAYPYIRCDFPGRSEIFFRYANNDQLSSLNALERFEIGYVNAALRIEAPANTKELTGVDPKRYQIFKKSDGKIGEIAFKRVERKELRRCITAYPTNALAQEAEMGLWEYRDFVFSACKLNEPDPPAVWKSESLQQHEIVRRLQGRDKVSLKGPNIDLTLSIKGRPFVVADGKVNWDMLCDMSQGEIFVDGGLFYKNGRFVK
jgi:aminopeptidase